MLDTLITNKTRVKLLLRFFLNPDATSYLESAYLNGMMAKGFDNSSMELVIFGDPIDQEYLLSLTGKATDLINREIICTTLPGADEKIFLKNNRDALLVWKR